MIYEQVYNGLYGLTRSVKKRYLAKALEEEALRSFENIDIDGWSLKEREEAYREVVLPYWNVFGKAPKRFWFEMIGSRDQIMDRRFLPIDLYYTEIIPYLNHGIQRAGLANKGYLDYLFSDVKRPRTVALKIEGIYYDEKRNIVGEDGALALCRENRGALFLKPSIEAARGDGIVVFTPADCSDDDIRSILRESGSSFIVQERVRQHPVLDSLNPTSVSTVRIYSLLMEDKVHIESAGLRVSAPGRAFVTVFDGGFYAEILEGGKLYPKVYSDIGEWYDHGNGIFDDSFAVPSMEKVYDEVRKIHPRMGHFKCLGWDFAIDEDGEPILLEFNGFPNLGCAQIARCKPVFNERTDWILEDIYLRRSWAKNHRQDFLIP